MMGPGVMPGMRPPMSAQQMQQMQMQQMQMQQGGAARPPAQQQQAAAGPQGSLNAAALAAAPPGVQKQMLGEKIFPAIAKYQPELAGKITGMLEMDNSELLILLESEAQLKVKVD